MQAPDALERVRREIELRLAGLRPSVAEYAAIEAAGRWLGDPPPAVTIGNRLTLRGRARSFSLASDRGGPAPAQSNASAGSVGARQRIGPNQAAIVKVLGEKATHDSPLTARQIADATRLRPTTVHGALRQLTKKGVVRPIKRSAGRKAFVLAGRGQALR
jgi:IclR helix-turn-helix domain